jgi:hypothetical protein
MTAARSPKPQARRGVYRGVYSCLVDDPDFQRLSPDARLVLLVMRLSSQIGAAGIFRAYTQVVAEQTGLELAQVEAALHELETSPTTDRPWIVREAGLVWIRNALRYDPNIRLGDPKHATAVNRVLAGLPRLSIVARFRRYYQIARPSKDPSGSLGRLVEDQSPPSTETETEYRDPRAEDRPSMSPNGHHPHGQDSSSWKGTSQDPRLREVDL